MTKNAIQSAQQRTDKNRQNQLGKALSRLYADTAAEPVQDDLLALLAQADKRLKPEAKL
jgi:hypothetical protein